MKRRTTSEEERKLFEQTFKEGRPIKAALPLADIGDFAIALGDLVGSMTLIEEQAHQIEHLVALGGDHSVTLPLLRAQAKRRGPPALVHLDAHVDDGERGKAAGVDPAGQLQEAVFSREGVGVALEGRRRRAEQALRAAASDQSVNLPA